MTLFKYNNVTFLQMMTDFPKCNDPLFCPWVLPNFCSKQNLALDHFFEIFLPLSIVLKIGHGSTLYGCKLYVIKCQIKLCWTSPPNSQTQNFFLKIPMNSGKSLECYVTVNVLSINYLLLAHIPFFKFTRETFIRFINCYSEIDPQASDRILHNSIQQRSEDIDDWHLCALKTCCQDFLL